jgi:hypothetical protein
MKRLRNPWVGAGLIVLVIAVGLGGWLRWHFQPARALRHGPASGRGPTTNPGPGLALKAALTNQLWPEAPVDLEVASSNFLRLTTSPPRDPFQLAEAAPPIVPAYSALSLLKLKAIWRQTDLRAVVINGQVFTEGETVEGFQIERVDSDRVWLKGPEKTESLTFDRGEQPPPPPPPVRKGLFPPHGLFGPPLTPAPKPSA